MYAHIMHAVHAAPPTGRRYRLPARLRRRRIARGSTARGSTARVTAALAMFSGSAMSLSFRQNRRLSRIEKNLRTSDPHLAAMLGIFGKLADSGLPGWEHVISRRDRVRLACAGCVRALRPHRRARRAQSAGTRVVPPQMPAG